MEKIQTFGFIGQGFIGKNMADDFADRGHTVVRYALDTEYAGNRAAIAECDVVFIAVPTPTTPQGFDASILESVLPLVGTGKVAVIKSTVFPGTTRRLQKMFPNIVVVHSPEFLRERFAAEDTRKPERTIIGLPEKIEKYERIAEQLLKVLPAAPFEIICTAEEAELIKYGGNCFLAMKVVYMNLLYDLAKATGADYTAVAAGIGADSRIGTSHTKVLDESGHGGGVGRGAGGHCFIKDWAALREAYESFVPSDVTGGQILKSLEEKNLQLLRDSGKDIDLIEQIYGK